MCQYGWEMRGLMSMPGVWVTRSDPVSPSNPYLPFEFEDAMANYRQAKPFQSRDEEALIDSDDRLGQKCFCFLFNCL